MSDPHMTFNKVLINCWGLWEEVAAGLGAFVAGREASILEPPQRFDRRDPFDSYNTDKSIEKS